MLDSIFNWLDTGRGVGATAGFLTYVLFLGWKKCASRWGTWFPLLTKVVKWFLYGCAIYVGLKILSTFSHYSDTGDWLIFVMFALGLGVGPGINFATRNIRPKEKVRRGARIADVATVNRESHANLARGEFKDSFQIGGVDIPRSAEPYHFFVVGSTGSGKSVAITSVLDHLEARGDIALVVDSGGEFSSRYYQEGRDHILNPFDARCAPWSPTAELAGPWDAEALAKSMIPDGVGDSKEWNAYAQTLVTSVLRQLSDKNRLSIKDLLYYVQGASMEELTPFLAGTPAAAQLVSDKTFGSIRTIASNYLATYAYLQDSDEPFSVAKFIRREQPGFLFMTYRDDQLDSLRNMISCALDVAARTILAMPASPSRRVWLIIDEFASIGKVQSIEAVATKARKMGGCLLLGLQSVSQLQDRYGDKGAQTILSCLSSWLVLRCSDADTAEYISRYIGDTEVSRMTKGESTSETGSSGSLSEQIQTQRAVLPVELQRLKNLQGYFKLSGGAPVCNVKLTFPKKKDTTSERYAERDFVNNPMLSFEAKDMKKPAEGEPASGGRDQKVQVTLKKEPSTKAAPEDSAMKSSNIGRRKIKKTPMESGPVALKNVLKELAEAYEDEM